MVDDSERGIIESAVAAMLPASSVPWSVASERGPDGPWTVLLGHEASNGLCIETGVTDPTDAIASVRALLSESLELERVGQAPKLEHPHAIAGLRALVQSFGWSRTEVAAVAGLLVEVGALNEVEAEWFTTWFGEAKPRPRATRIM